MRYGDKGEHVRRVQQQLLAAGYHLPRHGADGHLGDETWSALRECARDRRLSWEPEVSEALLESLAPPFVVVMDLRSEQSDPPHAEHKFKIVGGKVVRRRPSDVRGIMLHQTDVWYGVSDAQEAASDGDRHMALHRRSLSVACHLIAFDGRGAGLDCGHAVWPNPLDWYIYHGNGANAESIGIECEGKYRGLVSQGGTMPSSKLIQASRDAVRFTVEEGRRLGMPIEYIWAHRQSSASRRADPGESLWRSVVLEYAVPILGLRTEPTRTWGDGRPIPIDWDPAGAGRY